MADVIKIDLRGEIPKRGVIEFVRAEVPRNRRSSLALVRYARAGKEQATGSRLDLDKRVFIDHFTGDWEVEAAFSQAAPEIARFLSTKLLRRI